MPEAYLSGIFISIIILIARLQRTLNMAKRL